MVGPQATFEDAGGGETAGQAFRTLEELTDAVNGAALTSDGRFVISASEDMGPGIHKLLDDLICASTTSTCAGRNEGAG